MWFARAVKNTRCDQICLKTEVQFQVIHTAGLHVYTEHADERENTVLRNEPVDEELERSEFRVEYRKIPGVVQAQREHVSPELVLNNRLEERVTCFNVGRRISLSSVTGTLKEARVHKYGNSAGAVAVNSHIFRFTVSCVGLLNRRSSTHCTC